MTARTPASLSPHSVNLGLNLFSGHGLSGQRVQFLEHSTQVIAKRRRSMIMHTVKVAHSEYGIIID
jgi:hypothetical protein